MIFMFCIALDRSTGIHSTLASMTAIRFSTAKMYAICFTIAETCLLGAQQLRGIAKRIFDVMRERKIREPITPR